MKEKLPYYFDAHDKIFEFARKLRRSETSAERYFWLILRNRKIAGLKFRRQHPIGKYVVDFYCHEKKLAIELDGCIHDLPEVKNHDNDRMKVIEQLGVTVLRFTNDEIFNDLNNVINKIINNINLN